MQGGFFIIYTKLKIVKIFNKVFFPSGNPIILYVLVKSCFLQL